MTDRKQHWERVWTTKAADEVSWFQTEPAVSLRLIAAATGDQPARVLDVGGGTSPLAARLLATGHRVGILDLSRLALARARQQLGDRAGEVEWFEADVTAFDTPHPWDVWHDRAVFHFLTSVGDRADYREVLARSLPHGGQAIIATFGPQGPTECSDLPTRRYTPEELAAELGPAFELVDHAGEDHTTPGGKEQQFVYCRFAKRSH